LRMFQRGGGRFGSDFQDLVHGIASPNGGRAAILLQKHFY
jgi:hypothetical protein